MTCEESKELMSLYIDKQLDKASEEDFLKHLEDCEACRSSFDELKLLIAELNSIQLAELPESYHEELMEKLDLAKIEPIKNNKFSSWKKYTSIAAGIILFMIVGGIGGTALFGNFASKGNDNYAPQSFTGTTNLYSTAAEGNEKKSAESPSVSADIAMAEAENGSLAFTAVQEDASLQKVSDDRLKIKRLYLDIEVKSFDTAVETLKNKAEASGGYVEGYNSYVYYTDEANGISLKEGYLTLRIPSEQYENSKSSFYEIGKIKNENESTDDITSDYVDTEGRLKMQYLEEERLLDILGKCDTVEDIIKVEERLGIVRSNIESYNSALKNWDRLVSLCTVSINMREVTDSEFKSVAPDFFTKIKNSFIDSINNFVFFCQSVIIFIAGNLIPLAIVALLAFVAFRFIKKIIKKYKEKSKAKDIPKEEKDEFNSII